jgi:Ca2+-binding RTX toxin-like protein
MALVTGTSGADTLNGTDEDDVINGLAGDDTINGADGADLIDAGSGVDVVNGGAGNDTLKVSAVSTGFPEPPPTQFDGGTGMDTFDISSFTLSPQAFFSYNVNTRTISVANYRINNVEQLVGTGGRDIFFFFNADIPLTILGGAGNDQFNLSRTAVLIDGGAGNDFIEFGGGGGSIQGGSGDDLIEMFQVATDGATLDGGLGVDTLLYTYQHMQLDLQAGTASGFSGGKSAGARV